MLALGLSLAEISHIHSDIDEGDRECEDLITERGIQLLVLVLEKAVRYSSHQRLCTMKQINS